MDYIENKGTGFDKNDILANRFDIKYREYLNEKIY